MTGTRNSRRARPLPLELRWGVNNPLPARWVIADGVRLKTPGTHAALNFTMHMRALCADIVARCEVLRHVHMPQVLVTFTPSRNRSRYGLQARVTPLRFRSGAMTRCQGPIEYQVQRFVVDGHEILYILTFCLPRFLDQPFHEKLVTVFHELYHISPAFDGDLRRHPGRYAIHSRSKEKYDAQMAELARAYLADCPEPELHQFLKSGYRDLWEKHAGITGVVVPRPKLLPVGWATVRSAARNCSDEENGPVTSLDRPAVPVEMPSGGSTAFVREPRVLIQPSDTARGAHVSSHPS